MKKVSLFILVVGCSIFSITSLLAQNYKTAVGARIGYPLTLSGNILSMNPLRWREILG